MNRIWYFAEWLPYEIDFSKVVKHFAFLNSDELHDAGISNGVFRESPYPVAQLKITLKNFEVDCFTWESLCLVSETMREAMSLGVHEIQYFDVDASASAALPQSKNYKIMSIPVIDDVSDPPRSDYMLSSLVPDRPAVPRSINSVAIKPNVKPKYQLFFDKYFWAYRFCTDELAMKILRAGCTGVRFIDPSRMSPRLPMRFRTLRGVEEAGEWDSIKKIEFTTVVEVIDQSP